MQSVYLLYLFMVLHEHALVHMKRMGSFPNHSRGDSAGHVCVGLRACTLFEHISGLSPNPTHLFVFSPSLPKRRAVGHTPQSMHAACCMRRVHRTLASLFKLAQSTWWQFVLAAHSSKGKICTCLPRHVLFIIIESAASQARAVYAVIHVNSAVRCPGWAVYCCLLNRNGDGPGRF